MTLDALVLLLWRRAWVLVIGAGLGVGVAFGLTSTMTRVYTATATSFVSAVAAPGKGASYESAQFAVSRAKSYPPLVNSPEVLQSVISDLGLTRTVPDLVKSVSAVNPVDTLLVQVSAEAGTADEAARIANSAARHMSLRIQALETAGGKRTSPVDVQVAVPATAPQVASWPKPLINYVLGAVAGGVLGAFVVLAADGIARARRARAEVSQTPRATARRATATATATATTPPSGDGHQRVTPTRVPTPAPAPTPAGVSTAASAPAAPVPGAATRAPAAATTPSGPQTRTPPSAPAPLTTESLSARPPVSMTRWR